ncbi:MAG: serine hydrolase [Synechocystis sp.]|nr:serine hydrolase [Synechocystis sp.]
MSFFNADPHLGEMVEAILETVWQAFPDLQRDQIALTWLVYDPPVVVNTGGAISANEFWKYPVRGFSYRGIERIYPASVVKLFYLVAIAEWLHSEMVPDSPELERAIRDMVVESSNDATSFIVDVLTGTTSGPPLPSAPFETWKQQRNIVNRYFQSLGWEELQAININQKTWGEGYYGRERAFVGELYENRNMLTTNAVARLMHSIIGGVAVSSSRSQQMMQWLQRDLATPAPPPGEENQVTGFLGAGLPANARIWSKAGWTSKVRHDCAYIEIPGQNPYLLVVFTENSALATDRRLLPFISQAFANAC